VLDFRAHSCQAAPVATHAFCFRLRANAPEGQKRGRAQMRTATVQRCACRGSASPGGECARCRAKRLTAPSSLVSDTLRDPGRPLDPATRAGFESSLGHDFGGVRIHADSRAAASAAALDANAYTVGTEVVFGTGRYDPGSAAGRGLIAHELTHVRQQARATPSGPLHVVDDPAAEAEADTSARGATRRMPIAVQRQPDHWRLLPEARLRPPPAPLVVPHGSIRETYVLSAPPDIQLRTPALGTPTEEHPDVLPERLQRPTPTIIKPVPRCLPDRPLKWGDFTPGAVGGFGAKTVAPVVEENVQGNMMFRVVMDHAASKVLPKVPAAADRTKNGCATDVAACKQVFQGSGFGDFRRTPPQNCDAAEFTKSTATNAGECESVIGADCDRDAVAEAARLLLHEQGHFDLTCKLVGRADDALAAGRPFATVKLWLNTHNNAQQQQYEDDTVNGCVASEQAKWQTAIAGGLQAVPGP
jgi:Domain of unknown function (DUF4157)